MPHRACCRVKHIIVASFPDTSKLENFLSALVQKPSFKILKPVLPSFILAKWPVHLNLLDLITLTILWERYKLRSYSLSSHLRLDLPKGLFPVGLPVKILKALIPSSILTTWPAYLNFPDLITLIILRKRYKLRSYSFWSLLNSPFSSLLGPDLRLWILFSNTLSLHSSFNIRDHVSQPYSTTGSIIVLYVLIFKFLSRRLECLGRIITWISYYVIFPPEQNFDLSIKSLNI